MKTLRDALLPVLSSLRSIPGRLGFRPYQVSLVTISWSGDEIGQGTRTTTTLQVVEGGQPPRARWLSNEEVALAGYDAPVIEIGPITPNFPGGGYSLATLKAQTLTGEAEHYFELTGPDFPNGARFAIVGDSSDHGAHYTIRLKRTGDGS